MAGRAENRELPPLTQCPLCKKDFTNPRVLNCIHTFCLECLKEYSVQERKQPGQGLPCPICHKEHVIPDDGIEQLQKNVFMEHLLEIQTLEKADSSSIACQVCDADEEFPAHASDSNKAVTYCLDCRQYHCRRCGKHHQKQRFSQQHEMVELGKKIATDTLKNVKTYCNQHKDKQVEFYCYDCCVTFCVSCHVVRHNNHKSCDIAEISAKFYHNVEEDIGRVSNVTKECEKEAEHLDKLKTDFLLRVEAIKTTIRNDAEKLRNFIHDQEARLLQDLQEITDRNMQQVRDRLHEIQQHISMLDNFKQYIMVVKEKATPADVSHVGCSLHERADDLHAIPVDVDFVLDLINYKPEDFKEKYQNDNAPENIIGHVAVLPQLVDGQITRDASQNSQAAAAAAEDEIPVSQLHNNPQVIEVKVEPIDDLEEPSTSTSEKSLFKVDKRILNGAEIQGITVVKGSLYVVRKPQNMASAVPEASIEVYDLKTFDLFSSIPVLDLQYPWDMTSCTHFNCLYISDSGNCSVHKIQITCSNNRQKQWMVCDKPDCLSVNSVKNLLVTCSLSHLVKEYSTDGNLIHEIDLAQSNLRFPRHAVQLESGLLVIGHGSDSNPIHRVCLTDIDGEVIDSFGGPGSNKMDLLYYPLYLTAFHDKHIFVADSGNRRILLLTSNLVRVCTALSEANSLIKPFRMLIAQDTLLVVENFQSQGCVLLCSYAK